MKKILLPAVAMLFGLNVWSQDFPFPFELTVQNQTYQTLTDAISVDNNIAWDNPNWEIPLGFNFEYLEQTFNVIRFDGGHGDPSGNGGELMFGELTGSGPGNQIAPYMQDLMDAAFTSIEEPMEAMSDVAYKVTGAPGSRVFTLQWTDASFYNDPSMTISFQLRLFEGTNNIEMHYGPQTNLNDQVAQSYTGGIAVTLAKDLNEEDFTYGPLWALTGDPLDPEIVAFETQDDFVQATLLSSTPAPGTLYHFMPIDPESVLENSGGHVKVYPTVVREQVNIAPDGGGNMTVRVMDTTGRLVETHQFTPGFHSLSTARWQSGYYFLVVDTDFGTETHRLVKH